MTSRKKTSKKSPTATLSTIAVLNAQVAALTEQIRTFQSKPANDNGLRPFRKTTAEVRKAAHNAARQAQKRMAKGPGYTAKYKTVYDGVCNSHGFRGKYESRETRKAA